MDPKWSLSGPKRMSKSVDPWSECSQNPLRGIVVYPIPLTPFPCMTPYIPQYYCERCVHFKRPKNRTSIKSSSTCRGLVKELSISRDLRNNTSRKSSYTFQGLVKEASTSRYLEKDIPIKPGWTFSGLLKAASI